VPSALGLQRRAAPRNTPTSIVEKLNSEINAGLADAKISELGGVLLGGSSADFGRLMSEETGKWAKVIKFAGIKPE
jgi:Tripartite tricarboxylate transporter family receptor